MMDPPEHDRMRKLVSRAFTPRAIIAAWKPIARAASSPTTSTRSQGADRSTPSPTSRRRSRSRSSPRSSASPKPTVSRSGTGPTRCCSGGPTTRRQRREGMEAGLDQVLYFLELIKDKRAHPADDMITQLIEAEVEDEDGAPAPSHRRRDRRVRHAARRRGLRDRHEARRQRDRAVRPQPGRVAEGARRPGQDPRTRSRRCCATGRRRSTRAASRTGTPSGTASRSRPASRSSSSPARPTATSASTRTPTCSTSTARSGSRVGLGHGIHSCLGAALARLESRIAFEEMAQRWPAVLGRRRRPAPGEHVERRGLLQRAGGRRRVAHAPNGTPRP